MADSFWPGTTNVGQCGFCSPIGTNRIRKDSDYLLDLLQDQGETEVAIKFTVDLLAILSNMYCGALAVRKRHISDLAAVTTITDINHT